ncbi:hypothetical protein Tco_0314440, partial [Tanacetum coccineum]
DYKSFKAHSDPVYKDLHNSLNVVKSRAKPKKNKSKKDIWKPTGKVFTQIGYIWKPTGQTFTIVGNACPLTRITTTNEVPSRKPIVLESESPKPVVKLVYSKKPRKNKNTESVSKTIVITLSPLGNQCLLTNRNPVNPGDPQKPIFHLLLLNLRPTWYVLNYTYLLPLKTS